MSISASDRFQPDHFGGLHMLQIVVMCFGFSILGARTDRSDRVLYHPNGMLHLERGDGKTFLASLPLDTRHIFRHLAAYWIPVVLVVT